MRRVLKSLVIVAAALSCGFAFWRWVVLPYRCNASVTEIAARTDLAAKAESDYERVVLARRNLEQLGPLASSCPAEVRIPMLEGANFELLGQLDDALRSYGEALAIDRRPEIYSAVASVQIQSGRVEEGIATYVTAARYAPGIIDVIESPEVMRRVQERLHERR